MNRIRRKGMRSIASKAFSTASKVDAGTVVTFPIRRRRVRNTKWRLANTRRRCPGSDSG